MLLGAGLGGVGVSALFTDAGERVGAGTAESSEIDTVFVAEVHALHSLLSSITLR